MIYGPYNNGPISNNADTLGVAQGCYESGLWPFKEIYPGTVDTAGWKKEVAGQWVKR